VKDKYANEQPPFKSFLTVVMIFRAILGKWPIMGHEMMRFVGIYERWSRDEDA